GICAVGVANVSLDSVFFSSRRRHTRFKCDWSSDVCSSDLDLELLCCPGRGRFTLLTDCRVLACFDESLFGRIDSRAAHVVLSPRSEERRVGKECRSQRTPLRDKEKKRHKH